ncbi:MAG: nSTAND1 domain-containing NTPase, partial [Nocardioides sp.]
MRCAVLGPLEVRGDDDRVLSVPGAKERLLLAVLAAANPGSVSDDQLLETLWNGAPPRTGRKSLQAHVVRLRTALEPDRPHGSPGRYVVRRPDGYALALDRERLDATTFVDLTARGRALLSAEDATAADDLLRRALGLWRGTPYADWPDVTALEGERERLEGIWAHALEAYWEAELALGRHSEAVPELARLLRDHPLHEPWWALHALALYRCGRQADALDSLRSARSTLADELGVDPGTRLRELEQSILVHDPALELGVSARPPPTPAVLGPPVTGCPYKGLARYESDDAEIFRGRDRLVGTLVTALVDHRLLVVSGSSGAGKSSVVRAGLVPSLHTGGLPGSRAWAPVVVTPGRRPVDTLATLTGADPPSSVVLVCDQLEQLWSEGTPAGERAAFLDTVLGLLADDVVTRCVLVVRGDHVGRLAEHPDIAQLLHGALVMVPPLSETELRQVVEEPARAAGLAVEPDLTDVAVRDVLGRTGALPLLSTALAETWDRRRDGQLTLAGYLATGGVAGAVARSAETAFASLSEPAALLARRILVRLAEQDEHGTLRARRLPTAELSLVGADPAVTTHVVEVLVTRRLLARDGDHVEVAHEALLAAWPRLAAWLADDAVGRAVRRHLAPAAIEWDAHGRPDDELYRGTRLEAAAEWAADPDSGPTELERAFVERGVAQAQAELAAARDRAAAEAAGRRRTRRLAGVLAAALVLALVSAVVAVGFQRTAADRATEAQAAETVANANRLAALATSARQLDTSLLLAAAAVRTADTPATRDGLLNVLVEHRRAEAVHQIGREGVEDTALSANGRTMMITVGGGSPEVLSWLPGSADAPVRLAAWWPESIAVSPDGATLVASSGFEGLRTWTVDGLPLLNLGPRLRGYPRDVAFTPDGRLLVFLGTDRTDSDGYRGRLAEVDLERGVLTTLAWIGRTGPGGDFLDAAFTADGSALVVSRSDHRQALRVNVATGRATRLEIPTRVAVSQEFMALPRGAVQTWSDGSVTRYDPAGRAVQQLNAHRGVVREVMVLPGERQAVTAGDGGQMELWDVAARGGEWGLRESLIGHSAPVIAAEASTDGGALATASSDGQLVTWDLSDDAGFGKSYPGLVGRYVSNRLQVVDPGRLVVAPTRTLSAGPAIEGGSPGAGTLGVAAVFLDPRTGRVVDTVNVGRTVPQATHGSSVAVSPDRTLVAVTSILATTILDTDTREIVARIRVPKRYVSAAGWSPDGTELILGADVVDEQGVTVSGVLEVVDTTTWERVRSVPLATGTPQVLEWNADRTRLAVGLNNTGSLMVYDDQLHLLQELNTGEGGDTLDLSFSPDGRYLAAGRDGGQLSIIETVDTWQELREPVRVHGIPVDDVEWLPDSTTVVTAGEDETVSLYDVERNLLRGRALP